MKKICLSLSQKFIVFFLVLSCTSAGFAANEKYASPLSIIAAKDGKILYVALATGRGVSFINTTDGNIIETVNLSEQLSGMAISPDGKTLYVGGSGPGNYTKIQDAINDSSYRDTVFVYSGTYFENVKIDKSINLIGEGKYSTFIDGNPEKYYVLYLQVSNITLKEFTIRGCNFTNGGGIYITSSFNKIHNNIIKNNDDGIKLRYKDSNRNQIYENTITDADVGIHLSFESSNQTVFNNTIYSTATGIEIWYCSNNIIYDNSILICKRAIDVYHSSKNYIFKNYISHNNNGIGLYIVIHLIIIFMKMKS